MTRGPLPNPQRRRRNEPTIPTLALPAAGRKGTVPRPPKTYTLGKAGATWWRWAWHTPQATAWSAGDLYALARRAGLEDDLAALHGIEGLDLVDALEALEGSSLQEFRELIQRLAALATGKLALTKEARELDDRFGLTPKAMGQLRWSIERVEGAKETAASAPASVRRLRSVDPTTATG